ncbi:MAG: type II and III secretion system protein, partial [Elusimicrobiota bacterium]
EINSDRARELGFEWGGATGELASFTAGKRDTSFPMNLPRALGNTHFFDPISNDLSGTGAAATAATAASDPGATPAAAGATGAPTTGVSLTSSIFDLTSLKVVLRALVSRSEARFLGKPKVLTLNNKPAIIQIQRNSAVALQQVQSGTSGGTSSQATTVERYKTGLVLKVTPQINKEGYITMLVQPTFTDAQEAGISSSAMRVFDPISRGASTLVRVKNGQTLVLGGLLQSTETKVVRKVPFLGYIPLVGWLFTSTSSRRTNTDLVIFITPTIVGD